VALELAGRQQFRVQLCATAQHRELLDQVLGCFGIKPDYDLDLMRPGQSLAQTTARVMQGLERVLRESRPDIVLVQGDTTTTLCGALAAFYERIPVGHVEAGLRTWDPAQPFPEEMNRGLTSRLATLHFAATEWAAANLLKEGVDAARITVTGNTGIDAVLWVRDRLEEGSLGGWSGASLEGTRKLIVVTAHRRENFGQPLQSICDALLDIARSYRDVHIIYPVHRNPNVQDVVYRRLSNVANISLVDPIDYRSMVALLDCSYLILTDSGGLQEEAPSLGKPVLVLRETTERPEAVAAGTVKVVGTDRGRIVGETAALLDDPVAYQRMANAVNPYGDGQASGRIVKAIVEYGASS